MKRKDFYLAVRAKYKIEGDDGPSSSSISPGSSSPQNWQNASGLQSGYSSEEIRRMAVRLAEIVTGTQNFALEAWDIYSILSANGGKYLEMFRPILIKGISKEKALRLAEIFTKIGEGAMIK